MLHALSCVILITPLAGLLSIPLIRRNKLKEVKCLLNATSLVGGGTEILHPTPTPGLQISESVVIITHEADLEA